MTQIRILIDGCERLREPMPPGKEWTVAAALIAAAPELRLAGRAVAIVERGGNVIEMYPFSTMERSTQHGE